MDIYSGIHAAKELQRMCQRRREQGDIVPGTHPPPQRTKLKTIVQSAKTHTKVK